MAAVQANDDCLRREEWGLQDVWSANVKLSVEHLQRLQPVEGLQGAQRSAARRASLLCARATCARGRRAHATRRACLRADCYWLGQHVVRRFDVLGVVIAADSKWNKDGGQRHLYSLDDGSATITCIHWQSREEANGSSTGGAGSPVALGTVLRVRGKMTRFRGERQISMWSMSIERDPLSEPLRWLELEHLWQSVYSRDPRMHVRTAAAAARERKRAGAGDSLPAGIAELREAVLAHARASANGRTFTYASLLEPSSVVHACALSLVGTDAGCVRSSIQRAVQGLKSDGLIELLDSDADVYALFDQEAQLVPAILQHVRRASTRGDGIVTLAQLRHELEAHDGHRLSASDAQVRTALEALVERSCIYEAGRGQYHLT